MIHELRDGATPAKRHSSAWVASGGGLDHGGDNGDGYGGDETSPQHFPDIPSFLACPDTTDLRAALINSVVRPK